MKSSAAYTRGRYFGRVHEEEGDTSVADTKKREILRSRTQRRGRYFACVHEKGGDTSLAYTKREIDTSVASL